MSTKPEILKVLGKQRGVGHLKDENLRMLHLLLFLNILDTNREMERRGLGEGCEELYLRIRQTGAGR